MSALTPILASPNLALLLNGFQAIPEQGTIAVPSALMSASGNDGVEVLGNNNAEAFAGVVDRIVDEGRQMAERELRWGLNRRIPLEATDGTWLASSFPIDLESFDDDIDSDGGTLKGPDALGLVLLGPRDRYLRFDSREGKREITVGRMGPLAHVFQNIYIGQEPYAWTSWYGIDFLGRAIEGLRTYLEVDSHSQLDLVVALTNKLYSTGPYELSALGNPLLKYNDSSVRLDAQDGKWFVPDRAKVDPENQGIKVESQGKVIPNGRSQYPEAILEITGEAKEGQDEFITLWLRRMQRPDLAVPNNPWLLPLSGSALNIWSGAASWALSRI